MFIWDTIIVVEARHNRQLAEESYERPNLLVFVKPRVD